jgi:hypothetical protein
MPYQIVQQKDKKFKVCKADDKKVCFSKKGIPYKTARRQVRAIVSGESKKGGARLPAQTERWWKDRYTEFEDYARNLGVDEDELYPLGVFKVKFEAEYNTNLNIQRQSRFRVNLYDISTKLAQQNYDDFNNDDDDDDEEEKVTAKPDEEIEQNKKNVEAFEQRQKELSEKFRIYLLDRPTKSKGFTFTTHSIEYPDVYIDGKVGLTDKFLNIDNMTELYNYLKNELENTPAIDKKRKAFIINSKYADINKHPLIFAIDKVRRKLSRYNDAGNIGNNICVDKCSNRETNWDMLGNSIEIYILGCYLDEKDNIVFTTVAECSDYKDHLKIDYLCSANYGFTVFKAFRELQTYSNYTFWPNCSYDSDTYLKLQSMSFYDTVTFYWTQGLFNNDADYEYSIRSFQSLLDKKMNLNSTNSNDPYYKTKIEAINDMRKYIKSGECNKFMNALYGACHCGGNKFLFPDMLKEVGNSYKPISGTPNDTNHHNFNEGFLMVLDIAEEKIKEARKKIGKLLPQVPEAVKKIQAKEAEKARKQAVFEKTKRVLKTVPIIKRSFNRSLKGKDINIPLSRSNVESIVPQGESGMTMNFEIPERSARQQLRNRQKLAEVEQRIKTRKNRKDVLQELKDEINDSSNINNTNFLRPSTVLTNDQEEAILRKNRPIKRASVMDYKQNKDFPRENYLDRIKPARPSTLKRQISRLRPSVLRTSGLDQIEGYGVKGTKFYEELRRYGINPTDYLTQMKKWAKASGYDDKQLDFANNDVHKLRIMTEQGTKRFGRVGYKDYYIYRHLEKKKQVKKGYAKIMRDRFRKSHGAITKKRKLGRNSANELSVRILWHEEDDKEKKK